jgi:hypothetical protein
MPAGVSAYTALANVTLGSSSASVTFSSINQGYRDLVIVVTGAVVVSGGTLTMQFNGVSTSTYFMVTMEGNGSAAQSSVDNLDNLKTSIFNNPFRVSELGNGVINIMDYSATDKHKSVLARVNNDLRMSGAASGRWASTSAITSVTLFLSNSQSWATGSTFALYGVSA